MFPYQIKNNKIRNLPIEEMVRTYSIKHCENNRIDPKLLSFDRHQSSNQAVTNQKLIHKLFPAKLKNLESEQFEAQKRFKEQNSNKNSEKRKSIHLSRQIIKHIQNQQQSSRVSIIKDHQTLLQINNKNQVKQKHSTISYNNHQKQESNPEFQLNYQTINYLKKCKKAEAKRKQIEANNLKQKYESEQKSKQYKIDKKPQTASAATSSRTLSHAKIPKIPKTKLSIKNLDKMANLESVKQTIVSKNDAQVYNLQLRKIKSREKYTQQSISIDNSKIDGLRKIKKDNMIDKIPDFLKPSLQIYRQNKLKKEQIQTTNINIQQIQNKESNEPNVFQITQTVRNYNSTQNLVGEKLNLLQKLNTKRHITLENQQNIDSKQQMAMRQETKKQKKKHFKNKMFEQDILEIRGWEQTNQRTHDYFLSNQ